MLRRLVGLDFLAATATSAIAEPDKMIEARIYADDKVRNYAAKTCETLGGVVDLAFKACMDLYEESAAQFVAGPSASAPQDTMQPRRIRDIHIKIAREELSNHGYVLAIE